MSIKEFTQPGLGDPDFTSADRASLLEVLQRSRRIETRLTRFIEAEGLETGIQRPWWKGDKVMIPSPMTTIEAILSCIPEGWPHAVQVIIKDNQQHYVLCSIQLPNFE